LILVFIENIMIILLKLRIHINIKIYTKYIFLYGQEH